LEKTEVQSSVHDSRDRSERTTLTRIASQLDSNITCSPVCRAALLPENVNLVAGLHQHTSRKVACLGHTSPEGRATDDCIESNQNGWSRPIEYRLSNLTQVSQFLTENEIAKDLLF